MTKQDSRQPVSDPRQLTIDELNKVAGGHGVSPPPPEFDNLQQTRGELCGEQGQWGRVAQSIDKHNGAISK